MTAILFLFIYLFYTTGFNELLKVNTLVQHFHETQKNDNTVTFFQFLQMHYVTDDNNSRDNDRDRQLPFKSTDTHTTGNSIFCFSNLNFQPLTPRLFTVGKPIKIIVKDLFKDTDFRSSIWHPPQNA